jgi:hypothetical protein
MANAVDELRGRGWHETASHDDAGVAAAIERWVLAADTRLSVSTPRPPTRS